MSAPVPRVLVTAAAGKTGRFVVRGLLERGLAVRAMVRADDARAARLRAAGAEVVTGDLRDIGDLRRVMRGIQRAYWAAPVSSGALESALLFAAAAEEARLEVVVGLSQWLADPAHPSAHSRTEWLSDRVLSWLPSVGAITVDPGFFAENYIVTLPVVARLGVLTLPYGDGRNAPPSNEDIGGVAAALLADPGPHLGGRFRPTGPALVAPADVAAIIGEVLRRPVRYRDVSFGFFAKAAAASGYDAYTVAQLRWYVRELQAGTFAIGAPTTVVEDLLGRPADSMATIVRRAAASGGPAGAGGPLGLLLRTALTPAPSFRRYRATFEAGRERTGLAQDSLEWRAAHEPSGAIP